MFSGVLPTKKNVASKCGAWLIDLHKKGIWRWLNDIYRSQGWWKQDLGPIYALSVIGLMSLSAHCTNSVSSRVRIYKVDAFHSKVGSQGLNWTKASSLKKFSCLEMNESPWWQVNFGRGWCVFVLLVGVVKLKRVERWLIALAYGCLLSSQSNICHKWKCNKS